MEEDDQIDYNFQQDPWFSPKLIIVLFNKLWKTYGDNITKMSQFKRAVEMYYAAVTLLGAYELDETNKFWLQSNNQTTSPDVFATQLSEVPGKKVTILVSQMELTEFEDNFPTNDLIDFLKNTKLSPRKAYDNNTLIVVTINRIVSLDIEAIYQDLQKLRPNSTIYFIGKTIDNDDENFVIFSLYPRKTKLVRFNISKTANKYAIPNHLRLYLGTDEKIRHIPIGKVVTNLSNVFNFEEKDVEKYIRDGSAPNLNTKSSAVMTQQ